MDADELLVKFSSSWHEPGCFWYDLGRRREPGLRACHRKLTGVPYQQELNAIRCDEFSLPAERCAVAVSAFSASSASSAFAFRPVEMVEPTGRDTSFGTRALLTTKNKMPRLATSQGIR
jgi:hypothetical protein